MVSRVVATKPEVFLLDEPTADLNLGASHAIPLLWRETAKADAAVVVVPHAVGPAIEYAHRVVLVDNGRFVAGQRADQGLQEAGLRGMRAYAESGLSPLS